MSSIVDVYLHGSVHLTNPGLEELLADTLSQGLSHSLSGASLRIGARPNTRITYWSVSVLGFTYHVLRIMGRGPNWAGPNFGPPPIGPPPIWARPRLWGKYC